MDETAKCACHCLPFTRSDATLPGQWFRLSFFAKDERVTSNQCLISMRWTASNKQFIVLSSLSSRVMDRGQSFVRPPSVGRRDNEVKTCIVVYTPITYESHRFFFEATIEHFWSFLDETSCKCDIKLKRIPCPCRNL